VHSNIDNYVMEEGHEMRSRDEIMNNCTSKSIKVKLISWKESKLSKNPHTELTKCPINGRNNSISKILGSVDRFQHGHLEGQRGIL
jgi:hypothetical protein